MSAFPKLGQGVVRARKPAERRHPSALPAIPHMTFGPTTAGVMLKGKGDADGDVPTPYWGGTETRSVNRDLPTALRLGKSIWLLPMSLAFPRGGPAVPPKGASPTGRCAIPTATTLSPAQRDITLRNGNGFGIISDTKKQLRLMDATRKCILCCRMPYRIFQPLIRCGRIFLEIWKEPVFLPL